MTNGGKYAPGFNTTNELTSYYTIDVSANAYVLTSYQGNYRRSHIGNLFGYLLNAYNFNLNDSSYYNSNTLNDILNTVTEKLKSYDKNNRFYNNTIETLQSQVRSLKKRIAILEEIHGISVGGSVENKKLYITGGGGSVENNTLYTTGASVENNVLYV
jgi:hypothetical protein